MKPIKLRKKLRFRKETIADLNSEQLRSVRGGEDVYYQTNACVNPIAVTDPDALCPGTYTACITQCPSIGAQCAYC